MASIQDSTTDILIARRRTSGLFRQLFAPVVALVDVAAIMAGAVLTGAGYHLWFFGNPGIVGNYVEFGGLVALLFVVFKIARGDYAIARFFTLKRHPTHVLYDWTATFLIVFAVMFLLKASEIYSRGAVVTFYGVGLFSLWALRFLFVRAVVFGTKTGRIAARRVLLVGVEDDVVAFAKRYQPWNLGLQVVGMSILSKDAADHARDLERAVGTARALRPDDVFIVVPWSRSQTIDAAVDAFMTIPGSIHLAPERVLDRFDDVAIAKTGPMATLELTRPPLSTAEVFGKRLMDIVLSSVGLILLSPLFLVVAILIKREDGGRVFFLQQRYGFNQRPFRILKFRTMRAMDDGAVVRQATKGDPRITRIGAFLRRWNIDELPQLVNVLLGQMSIVGPRPHAVAHNRAYENRISLYARRHNVKPGITGWAQVNGHRGETDTDAKMAARVEHDLHYIDNWSFMLDVKIIVMTVVSPKAFRNAV